MIRIALCYILSKRIGSKAEGESDYLFLQKGDSVDAEVADTLGNFLCKDVKAGVT